jgi:hypothetical protein
MPTPIEDYKAAGQEHRDALERCKIMVERIRKGAEILKQWETAVIANVQAVFPDSAGFRRPTMQIDGANWPTGQQLGEALAAYHSTREKVFRKFDAIPEPEREILQGPNQLCGH